MPQNSHPVEPAAKSRADRRIKLVFLAAGVLIALLLYLWNRNPSFPGWSDDLAAALQQARQENRQVVVFFMPDPREEQARFIYDNIITKKGNEDALRAGPPTGAGEKGPFLRVVQKHTDLQSDLARQYKLKELPTLLLLDSQGREINRREKIVAETDFRGGFLDCSSVQKP